MVIIGVLHTYHGPRGWFDLEKNYMLLIPAAAVSAGLGSVQRLDRCLIAIALFYRSSACINAPNNGRGALVVEGFLVGFNRLDVMRSAWSLLSKRRSLSGNWRAEVKR